MKTTSAFLMILVPAFLGLTACTPRDPEVLTQADKDFVRAQKSKGKNGAAGSASNKIRPTLPQRVDLSLGLLMMDREAEALSILKNAQVLVKSDADKIQEGCVRTKLIAAEKNSRVYQISKELCQEAFGGEILHTVNGTAILKIDLSDSGEILGVLYDTPNLTDETLGVTEYQVAQKGLRMTFIIKDEIHLKIDKKAETNKFRISMLQTNSTYRQVVDAVETTGQMSYDGDGYWTLLETGEIQSQFHSKLRFKSQVSNAGDGTTGGDSYFDLVIDSYNQNPTAVILSQQCNRPQTTYNYELSFGNGSRKGALSLSGNQLVAVSKDPKTQKEDKASLNLKECTQRAPLAWDQLMVPAASKPPRN